MEIIQRQIANLITQIKRHNSLYYEQDDPEISDFEYDTLFGDLKILQIQYPEIYNQVSSIEGDVLSNVGGDTLKTFEEFEHPTPMMSLNNVMNEKEFLEYIERTQGYVSIEYIQNINYVASLKFDGLAVELIYRDSKMDILSTRGNGFIGENVTHNQHLITNHISILPKPIPRLVIRGEVVMMKDNFHKLNENRQQQGLPLFSNPRNVAAGTLRQLDATTEDSRVLHLFIYQLENHKEIEKTLSISLDTYDKQMTFLTSLGFDTNEQTKKIDSVSEVIDYYNQCAKNRQDLPYEIDGVVVRYNNVAIQNMLSEVARRPRYAIAWKFPPSIRQTTLLTVEFQIGRTGILTPVAILDPVNIDGVTVQRATLHNEDEIIRKDIRINDTVEIIRSGDVIPKIIRVLKEKRTESSIPIQFPSHCLDCQHPITKIYEGSGTSYYCENPICPSQIHQRILHFCSKEAMNIEGIDDKLIKELLNKKLIYSFADLYLLKEEDFNTLERMGDKRKENLQNAISKSKTTTLSRFIYALGIKGVGQKMASLLSKKFQNIQNILTASNEDFLDIDGVGEAVSKSIHNFLNDPIQRNNIQQLLDLIIIENKQLQNSGGIFSGKKILFTGTLSIPRNIAKDHVEKLGGDIVSSISKNTSLLIYGENPGSKLTKAKELGVETMNEQEFLSLI